MRDPNTSSLTYIICYLYFKDQRISEKLRDPYPKPDSPLAVRMAFFFSAAPAAPSPALLCSADARVKHSRHSIFCDHADRAHSAPKSTLKKWISSLSTNANVRP